MKTLAPSEPALLSAGAARADITPDVGMFLGGDISNKRAALAIEDRLWANVLALAAGDQRLCIVSTDLVNIKRCWTEQIRQRAAQRFGISPNAVMVHALHNHAAPELGGNALINPSPYVRDDYAWIAGGDDRYNEPAVERMVDAIGRALAAARPTTVSVGRALDDRWVYNRRFIMRDGTRMSNIPPNDPNILRSEHPVDPEVTVVRLADARTGQPLATLLSYTGHPTFGWGRDVVISDWPGAWAALANAHAGAGHVALVLNGCLGNIASRSSPTPAGLAPHKAMAAGLFETSLVALQRAAPITAPLLAHRQSVLHLPLRVPTESELAWARTLLTRHPTPDWSNAEQTRCSWDWRYAIEILDLERSQREQRTFAYEINAIRLGSLALVTLMGEPFVEAQFELKLASKADFTIVAALCNGYVGYLPTAEAWGGKGFEVRTSNHAKLQRDALATVTSEAIRMLNQLFDIP